MTGPDGKGGSLDRLCYRFGADSFTWLGEYHSNQEVPAPGVAASVAPPARAASCLSRLTPCRGHHPLALVNCPRRATVPAASCRRTPNIHPNPIPIFQIQDGASSKTI